MVYQLQFKSWARCCLLSGLLRPCQPTSPPRSQKERSGSARPTQHARVRLPRRGPIRARTSHVRVRPATSSLPLRVGTEPKRPCGCHACQAIKASVPTADVPTIKRARGRQHCPRTPLARDLFSLTPRSPTVSDPWRHSSLQWSSARRPWTPPPSSSTRAFRLPPWTRPRKALALGAALTRSARRRRTKTWSGSSGRRRRRWRRRQGQGDPRRSPSSTRRSVACSASTPSCSASTDDWLFRNRAGYGVTARAAGCSLWCPVYRGVVRLDFFLRVN